MARRIQVGGEALRNDQSLHPLGDGTKERRYDGDASGERGDVD
jgi:hypothetical protein